MLCERNPESQSPYVQEAQVIANWRQSIQLPWSAPVMFLSSEVSDPQAWPAQDVINQSAHAMVKSCKFTKTTTPDQAFLFWVVFSNCAKAMKGWPIPCVRGETAYRALCFWKASSCRQHWILHFRCIRRKTLVFVLWKIEFKFLSDDTVVTVKIARTYMYVGKSALMLQRSPHNF